MCKRWTLLIEETLKHRYRKIVLKIFETDQNLWNFQNGINGIKNLHVHKNDFIKDFTAEISQFYTEPKTCIFFLTNDFFMHQNCIIKSNNSTNSNDQEQHPEIVRRKNFKENSNHIVSLLPKNSLKIFICSEGLIWRNSLEYIGNKTESPDFELINFPQVPIPPVSPVVGGLFFPQHENYQFRNKHLSNNTQSLFSIHDKESLFKFLGIQSNESLKFLYIIANDFFGHVKEAFVEFLQRINTIRKKIGKNSSENFAVTGSLVNEIYVHDSPREYQFISDEITILSLSCKKEYNESVKVAQMILTEKGDDYDEYYSESDEENEDNRRNDPLIVNNENYTQVFGMKINALKKSKLVNSHNEANTFVLLNTNKYTNINKIVNQQASLFHDEFPKWPIVGLLSFHQIGHDFFPTEQNENQRNDITPNNSNKFNYDVKLYETGMFSSAIFTVISLPK